MKDKIKIITLLLIGFQVFAQENDTIAYKKRVLESTEIDFLLSYYKQDGSHSSVSGGIGSENLKDLASNITISMPLNDDDVLTVDTGISAYTSASSSNINPFNASGASRNGDDDDDRILYKNTAAATTPIGTPWQASSGASAQDVLASVVINYAHSSDNRNFLWNTDVAFSNEFDYTSIGFGGGISKLFNDKNSEISAKANVYLDQWRPIYPTELSEYGKYGSNFRNQGFFAGVNIYEQNGNNSVQYLPTKFKTWDSTARNSYSLTLSFSQVINKKLQGSVFVDILHQNGKLSTPYHRIYFADKNNFYIGNTSYIANYENEKNKGVYRLADDIEHLPSTRFKVPFGGRLNYYINEKLVIKTYYRYYWDDWGISSHTASIELPYKITESFTIYPMYRYYTQQQSKYFAPFEKHLSSETFYTSDYDLSSFNANQVGFGFNYTDIYTKTKIWKFGLKNIDFRFNHYNRTDGLVANIGTLGFKFIME